MVLSVFEDEHFSIVDTLDLAFNLLVRRKIREGGDAFQFVFLGHGGVVPSGGLVDGGC